LARRLLALSELRPLVSLILPCLLQPPELFNLILHVGMTFFKSRFHGEHLLGYFLPSILPFLYLELKLSSALGRPSLLDKHVEIAIFVLLELSIVFRGSRRRRVGWQLDGKLLNMLDD